jgi:glutathione synthase/RimK-type ligase-like ATP-grasp enzyme
MIRLGLLTVKNGQELGMFTKIAQLAKKWGISVVRFTPTSIQPITHDVNGYSFHPDKNAWVEATFPIPPFIYDRCFYTTKESYSKNSPIVEWLKKSPNTNFLGYGLPSKWSIYQSLKSVLDIAPFLPITEQASSEEVINNFLQDYKTIILKPDHGSQGKGIFKVTKKRSRFEISTQNKENTITKEFETTEDFQKFLNSLIIKRDYLVQPFYSLSDRSDRPFDIRILMQKNKFGEWSETGRGVRTGSQSHFVSNLFSGATISNFDDYLQTYSYRNKQIILSEIDQISKTLPKVLEDNFSRLFELGIDIGIDKYLKIYILDCNSKPGRKVALETNREKEMEIIEAPLAYCSYLANKLRA